MTMILKVHETWSAGEQGSMYVHLDRWHRRKPSCQDQDGQLHSKGSQRYYSSHTIDPKVTVAPIQMIQKVI